VRHRPAIVSAWNLLLLAGCLAGLSGCAPGTLQADQTIVAFMTAIQEEDLDRLYCLSAGAAQAEELGQSEPERRANFESWARAHLEAYLDGRDAGWVEPGEHGLGLVKMFSLGRGTFYSFERVRALDSDTRRVRTRLNFGYAALDLSRLSPGTTFYLAGAPVGTIEAVRVPAGSKEIRVEVLDSVSVEWTLVRSSGSESCPPGWAVASAQPVDGSEQTTELTWVF